MFFKYYKIFRKFKLCELWKQLRIFRKLYNILKFSDYLENSASLKFFKFSDNSNNSEYFENSKK